MTYISNVDVFFAMAEEAHAAMTKAIDESREPKADGDGFIISFDPSYTSFKQACVVIAFAGMYLEAFTYLITLANAGQSQADKVDKVRAYSEKLMSIGVRDPDLLAQAEDLRRARRELVHEKAIKIGEPFKKEPLRAQSEADKAINVIRALRSHVVAP